MCGIVGFLSTNQFSGCAEDLTKAMNSLAHRGPDDSGHFFDYQNGVGLGHRRLSIIDLSSGGYQPMKSSDGTLTISYNGELYNYLEIRKTLEQEGYSFKSKSDTEVLINSFQHWGADCIKKFIGMFVFAIWDSKKEELTIARDRMGIKPLYYYLTPETFIFASELKAIMAFRTFRMSVDMQSIASFLHYRYVPAPHSIFQNTFKLQPGRYLVYDGTGLRQQQYWKLPRINNQTDRVMEHEQTTITDLEHVLKTAVQDRLVSDVPLGALLSGGIDSSLIAALMQQVSNRQIQTFSIGFNDKRFDEAPWAARIAKHLGTSHTELYLDSEKALEVIPKLPVVYDEPFADASGIPTFMVSQLTKKYVTVALSGDGGDELFAGYVRYWMTVALFELANKIPQFLRSAVAKMILACGAHRIESVLALASPYLPNKFRTANTIEKLEKLTLALEQSDLCELYKVSVCVWSEHDIAAMLSKPEMHDPFNTIFNGNNTDASIAELMYIDQHTYLPDEMLTKIDRASMANSLEVRVPLLDHRVVEFAARIPLDFKFRDGDSKFILKKILGKYVPSNLFERPKMGFAVPLNQWFRADLKEMLCDYLSYERIKAEGLFNPEIVDQMVARHLDGESENPHQLWSLLMWQMWREQWLR
jgi:asparagine synthase (glutamine-hydrolysing)